MVTPTTIGQVRLYRQQAANLRGATDSWNEKYSDRKHYDKQGFGFTLRTDAGWNAFKVPSMAFEAYTGTYGSSSVGRSWAVDQGIIDRYLCVALNVHRQKIFNTIADLLDKESAGLVKQAEAELAEITRLLDEARLASADRSGEADETSTEIEGSAGGESAVGAEGAETPKSDPNPSAFPAS